MELDEGLAILGKGGIGTGQFLCEVPPQVT